LIGACGGLTFLCISHLPADVDLQKITDADSIWMRLAFCICSAPAASDVTIHSIADRARKKKHAAENPKMYNNIFLT
jgi:hypothetical protein